MSSLPEGHRPQVEVTLVFLIKAKFTYWEYRQILLSPIYYETDKQEKNIDSYSVATKLM